MKEVEVKTAVKSDVVLSSEDWKIIEYDDYRGYLVEYRFILDKKVRFRIRDKEERIIYRSLSKRYADDKEAFQDAKMIIDNLLKS